MTDLHLPISCRVIARHFLAKDIYALTLEMCARAGLAGGGEKQAKKFAFAAGQYAMVALPDDPAHAPRPYSIASDPDETFITFHIKDGGHGISHVMARAPIGTHVILDMPHGKAVYRRTGRPILALGGGLGLAPLLPIVRHALRDNPQARIYVYHGAYDRTGLYLHENLQKMAADFAHFHYEGVTETYAPGCGAGLVGSVAASRHKDLSGFDAYLSGAPAMVSHAFSELQAKGLDSAHTYSDALSREIPAA